MEADTRFSDYRMSGFETSGRSTRLSMKLLGVDFSLLVHPELRMSDGTIYDCVATIPHIGEAMKIGRYLAIVRKMRAGKEDVWVRYNNKSRSTVEEADVKVRMAMLQVWHI